MTNETAQDIERPLVAAPHNVQPGALRDAMQAVEQVMFDVVDSDVSLLRDASRHILKAGGKRLRPRLALLSYAAVGGTDLMEVVPVAAAIELMHTASVVHDDINDHGTLRRGRPSVNALYGRTFALLTGDFLFTKVYELMAPYQDLNIVLAEGAVALVEGETLQAQAVKERNFTRQVYYDIIGRKTAALFRSSCRLGAALAGSNRDMSDALGAYGYEIGLAFQIVDDILDLTADAAQIGKTSGIDLAQGKGFAAVTGANGAPDDPMDTIRRKLLQGDAVEEARLMAREMADRAVAQLSGLPPTPARDELADMALAVVERDF